jgi:hypothetical protein
MKARRAALMLLVAVAALAAAAYAVGTSHDFKAYWYNVPNVFGGPYPTYGPNSGWGWPLTYRSAPLFLFLFAPLTLLPLRAAAGMWAAGKIATLAWLAPRLHRFTLQGRPRRGSAWAYAWMPALACYAYLVREIESGNVQFYVFALTAMGFIWMRTWPNAAALSLAGARGVAGLPFNLRCGGEGERGAPRGRPIKQGRYLDVKYGGASAALIFRPGVPGPCCFPRRRTRSIRHPASASAEGSRSTAWCRLWGRRS